MVIMLGSKITEEKLATFRKHGILGGREKFDFVVSQFDDYVKHIFNEHSQESDHRANSGAEGQMEASRSMVEVVVE